MQENYCKLENQAQNPALEAKGENPMKIALMVILTCLGSITAIFAAPVVQNVQIGLSGVAAPPKFQIRSVAQLKNEILTISNAPVLFGSKRIVISPYPSQPQNPGNPGYRTGNGVVLNVNHPMNSNPDCGLLVQNVEWDQNTWADLSSDNPDYLLSQFRSAQQPGWSYLATALFKDLPSAQHTYLLTIGTTAKVSGLKLELLRGSFVMPEYTPSVSDVVQEIGPEKLLANPGFNEVRALFTYAAGAEPLSVRWYWGPAGSTRAQFHHLQLVQLD
jgi:hypothetical protein